MIEQLLASDLTNNEDYMMKRFENKLLEDMRAHLEVALNYDPIHTDPGTCHVLACVVHSQVIFHAFPRQSTQ